MPEEKDIYDIENKIDANEFNKNDNSDEFERENYISNRDISIPKKIVPTTDTVTAFSDFINKSFRHICICIKYLI